VPHFHATYAGDTVVVAIETGEVLAGSVSMRAQRMVDEWVPLRRAELQENWDRARRAEPLEAIPPLPSHRDVDLARHLHRITAVEIVGDHELRLTFDDGLRGIIDASGWDWNGVFAPLRDPAYFAQVTLDRELGAISWPNGADVAPETLHLWVSELRDRQPA
jgi:hypothetical protein